MNRAPGLSVRLRLTLSYAGFLMVAGVLLLAVVWLFLLRYVPADAIETPAGFIPGRSDLIRAFAPPAACGNRWRALVRRYATVRGATWRTRAALLAF